MARRGRFDPSNPETALSIRLDVNTRDNKRYVTLARTESDYAISTFPLDPDIMSRSARPDVLEHQFKAI